MICIYLVFLQFEWEYKKIEITTYILKSTFFFFADYRQFKFWQTMSKNSFCAFLTLLHTTVIRRQKSLLSHIEVSMPIIVSLKFEYTFSLRNTHAFILLSMRYWGPFDNYVDKMREGRGSKNVCFCPRIGYKNCPRRWRVGGQKMTKFCPRSCCLPPRTKRAN